MTRVCIVAAVAVLLSVACRESGESDEGDAITPGDTTGAGAVIMLTPRALAATAVEAESANVSTVPETFATTGQIEFDPSRVVVVNAPIAGRIERLAHAVGDRVTAGDTLVTIASPEFLSGRFALTAPRAGVVTNVGVALEQVVTSGAELIRIAAIDRIWLSADFYGERARLARIGTRVVATVTYLPGRAFRGRVASVSPNAEGPSQSAVAHVPLDNPDEQLLPGMFADVLVETGRTIRGILVPRASIIYDGGRRLVMIQQDTTFFPAVIQTGPVVGDRVVVLRGVQPGEWVVVRGGYELYSAGYAFVRGAEGDENE